MGKSIYTTREILSGEIIAADDIELKAPADGLPAYLLPDIVGCAATRSIKKGGAVHAGDIAEAVDQP